MKNNVRRMMLGLICWQALMCHAYAAEKTMAPEVAALIGMQFKDNEMPKGYRMQENSHVVEYRLEQGRRHGTSRFRFGHAQRFKNRYLWLARPAGGDAWVVVDAVQLPALTQDKLLQNQHRSVEVDQQITITDRVYGLLNKKDYRVIRAWAVDAAKGKIAEIPTGGLVFEDDRNPFLFTGSDPNAGAVTDQELASLIGRQSGQAATLPGGVKSLGGYLIEGDDAIGFYLYKKSHIALLEKFMRRDASGHPYFRVLDAIRLDMTNSETNEADCTGGGAMRLVIVDKRSYRARRAWAADVKRGKFIKIPVKGITCTAPDNGD